MRTPISALASVILIGAIAAATAPALAEQNKSGKASPDRPAPKDPKEIQDRKSGPKSGIDWTWQPGGVKDDGKGRPK